MNLDNDIEYAQRVIEGSCLLCGHSHYKYYIHQEVEYIDLTIGSRVLKNRGITVNKPLRKCLNCGDVVSWKRNTK